MNARMRSERPHENLHVWRRAVEFVVRVYDLTKSFPSEEKFGLTSQIRRAAVSIPANIAEGAARKSHKEFIYFISNAQDSVSELATELLIAHRLGYLSRDKYEASKDELNQIGRMLFGLARNIRTKTASAAATSHS